MSLFLKIIRRCGQGFSSFNNGRSSSVIYDKVKFNLTLLNQLCCIGGVLASQKLARSEDECTGNGDLRLICGHTRKDRIRNNDIQNKAGVTSIGKDEVEMV